MIFTAAPLWAKWTYQQAINLDGIHPNLRGVSGFEITGKGVGFIAVTDFGDVFHGTLRRKNGLITHMGIQKWGPLLNPQGQSPTAKAQKDAEGLAIAPDGNVFVSFEQQHRIWRYDNVFSAAKPINGLPDLSHLEPNKGLEGLAIAPDGAIWAIPERLNPLASYFSAYRGRDGVWDIGYHIPKRGFYLITGADFGPDGKLYVLERNFLGLFATRVRRIDIKTGADDVIWQNLIGVFDNLEGISVWRDETGAMRMTLISDDNSRSAQQTQLLEFMYTE